MADNDVVRVQRLEHGHDIGRAVLCVGVAPAHNLPLRGLETRPDGGTIAAHGLVYQANARILGLDLADDFRRIISAIVVNDDNLVVVSDPPQGLHAVIYGSCNVDCLVEGRQYQGDCQSRRRRRLARHVRGLACPFN